MSAAAPLDPEDWLLWHAFCAMRNRVDRALEQRVQQDAGLSLADFEVLRGLAAAEGHRLRAGALAETLGWEKSRISHQVRRMAERGLLAKETCDSDGRGTWVQLSTAGADAFATASCGYVELLRERFVDRLDDRQRAVLRAAADRVQAGGTVPA